MSDNEKSPVTNVVVGISPYMTTRLIAREIIEIPLEFAGLPEIKLQLVFGKTDQEILDRILSHEGIPRDEVNISEVPFPTQKPATND